MKHTLVAAFITLLCAIGCTHQQTQATSTNQTAKVETTAGAAVPREPALWTQTTITAAELSRAHITCKNADKLAGQHSGVLKADANFGFSGSGPSGLSVTLEMSGRGAISKNIGCSGGSLQGETDSFVITCASDSRGSDWVFSLTQEESIYAKQNSLAFFKGSLAIPMSAFQARATGSDSIQVNCLARVGGSHTAADEHYLSEMRHMFGHQEHD
jgi:hypothetical protein